jgi:hypothetical protein
MFPTGAIEDRLVEEVAVKEFFGLVNLFLSDDRASKILIEPILQTKEGRLRERSPGATLEVRINETSILGVLLVVADLVQICQPTNIVEPIEVHE